MEGKNIVITGATGGFGAYLSRRILQTGANLFLIARNQQKLTDLAEELSLIKTGTQTITCFCADFENPLTQDLTDQIQAIGKIDVLINNAAIHGPIGPVWETDMVEWETAFRVNFYSVLELCRMVTPLMIQQQSGSIINISGGGATGSRPNFSSYAIAKTALVRLTEILADEIAVFGIRINAISPGAMATNLLKEVLTTDSRLVGEKEVKSAQSVFANGDNMEKAAELCVYLASDKSKHITGRLVSAIWDDWENPAFTVADRDDYKLRRKTP